MEKTSELSDQILLEQYRAGNDNAFGTLATRYYQSVYNVVFKLMQDGDLANDLVQDTFEKVCKRLRNKSKSHDTSLNFQGWICRIAKNICIDHYRQQKRALVLGSKEIYGEAFDIFEVMGIYDESPEDKIIQREVYKDMRDLVRRLQSDQKEVLIMRLYCGLSFKEIAFVFDVSINTALGRMRYALNNLRKFIKERDRQTRLQLAS